MMFDVDGDKSLACGDETKNYEAGTVVWAAGIESAAIAYEAAKQITSIGRGEIKIDEYLVQINLWRSDRKYPISIN